MEITIGYTSVTQIGYQFNEHEIKRALVEFVRRKFAERLLDGDNWEFEWWDKDASGIRLVATVTQKSVSPAKEPDGQGEDGDA